VQPEPRSPPASAGVVPRMKATAPDHATVHEPGRDCTVVVPSKGGRVGGSTRVPSPLFSTKPYTS